MSSDAGPVTLERGTDIEDNLRQPTRSGVPNIGSAARDYCASERTLLSYARLGLVLSLLSASLLLKARIPNPDDERDSGQAGGPASFSLGTIYAIASILVLLGGWLGYESDLKGLLRERGFVGGFKFSEAVTVAVATLLFVTCVLLLGAGHEI